MKVKSWLALGLVILLNILTSCGGTNMNTEKSKTNYKWFSVATAPRQYPMEIINGVFYYKGHDIGDLIPAGGTLRQGWGESASVYVKGPEIPPLPDRVRVTFYSYAENKFYQADFALPYDDILAKFQQQEKLEPDNPYDKFLLGVAPGGAIVVWIKGPRTTEVYFGYAEEVELTPTQAFKLPFKDKKDSDDYVEKVLSESVTPEQFAYIKKYGPPFGAWERFRKLYRWEPVYKDGKVPYREEMPATFVNGEFYKIPTQFTEEYANNPKPLLKETNFRAGGAKGPVYEIEFDEMEIVEIFEKLGSNGEKVYLEFDPQLPELKMKIRAYNDKESIEFKKVKVK